jgi:predicted transcriptional regulator
MEEILESLGTTRQALLPQIRILEKHHLVDHSDDTYELTRIGKLTVDEMVPLLNILEVLDADVDYWGTHNLDFIPHHLLERINEIGECSIISPSTEKMYEAHNELIEVSTQYHFSITTFFYPNFPDLFSQMFSKGTTINVILSQSLFDKLRTDNYNDIQKLLSNDLVHFFLYPEKMDFLSFVFSEHMVMISPLKSNGEFDNKHILCKDAGAIAWAKELYGYYLKGSLPITEL